MRKIIQILIAVFISTLFISCEDDFSPKTGYEEKYVLNCVVRADTTLQMAVLTKSYDVPGYNPFQNTTDPTIDDAYIRIWYQDTVYTLRDSLVDRIDTTRYNFPVKIYYTDDFQPALNTELEIEALLPNGRRLRAFTTLPQNFRFTSTQGNTIPPEEGDLVTFNWATGSNSLMYLPRLSVLWYKKNDPNKTIRRHQIPLDYIDQDGQTIKYYANADRQDGISYKMSVIERSLKEISAGDENKENYVIILANIEVITMDENLASYYASTSVGGDNFSVRLDEADYSNIQGGYGVFGSYIKKSTTVFFNSDYIRSLGYKPEI